MAEQVADKVQDITQVDPRYKDWKPGDYFTLGTTPPKDVHVCVHKDGYFTLQIKANPKFNADIVDDVIKKLDEAWNRSFVDPCEEHPQGRRPDKMLVNDAFHAIFKDTQSWGDLQPPCHVRDSQNEKDYDTPHAVKVGDVRILVVTKDGHVKRP